LGVLLVGLIDYGRRSLVLVFSVFAEIGANLGSAVLDFNNLLLMGRAFAKISEGSWFGFYFIFLQGLAEYQGL
jgi:hypothetical protein